MHLGKHETNLFRENLIRKKRYQRRNFFFSGITVNDTLKKFCFHFFFLIFCYRNIYIADNGASRRRTRNAHFEPDATLCY